MLLKSAVSRGYEFACIAKLLSAADTRGLSSGAINPPRSAVTDTIALVPRSDAVTRGQFADTAR